MDYGTSFTESSFQWRFPLGFQALFAVFLVLQLVGLPETPRWLVQHDRHEEAQEVVAVITDKDLNSMEVDNTVADIQAVLIEESKDGPFRFKELFTWGQTQNFRRLLLTISIQLAQQFSGSNMLNYYMPVVFSDSMGLSRNLSLILGGCAQCTYLVGSAIPVFLMDRYGRRVLLMACSAGLSFCFVMVTILLSIGGSNAGYGATAFISSFSFCWALVGCPCLGSIPQRSIPPGPELDHKPSPVGGIGWQYLRW